MVAYNRTEAYAKSIIHSFQIQILEIFLIINNSNKTHTKMSANELREQGNEAFKQSQFKKAANYYSQAIYSVLNPLNIKEADEDLSNLQSLLKGNDCLVKCFNNRAQCYLKLESYQKAVDDANKG